MKSLSLTLPKSSSNRTIVGLKLGKSSGQRLNWHCSNRTIVGLKLALYVVEQRKRGSNRTIVGLKPMYLN